MIKRKDYELIKSIIHMSIVPNDVKKNYFKDKQFKKWYYNENKRQKI